MNKYSFRLLFTVSALFLPASVQAHGFAQRYDLPVPLTLYILGAAAAVALSFVIIAIFLRGQHTIENYPRYNLLETWLGSVMASRFLVTLLRLLSVALLILVSVAGLIGSTDPFQNIAPTTVWVIWWVGLAYISGLLGDLWALLNPWKTVHEYTEKLAQVFRPGTSLSFHLTYPAKLGDWPAVVLFLIFIWAELVWANSDTPLSLSLVVILYSGITWLGMIIFGRHVWLRHGEAFSLVFGFLARFAPTEVCVRKREICANCSSGNCQNAPGCCINCYECFEKASADEREWNLRPWAVGLLANEPVSFSRTVLILIILSSVTFDGLLATPLWATVANWMLYAEIVRPAILALQDVTGNAITAITTIALIVFLLAFQFLYLGFCALMRAITPSQARDNVSLRNMAGLFVLSLIPISLAYHLAHYLSFLLIVGQYMIPLASDPFGMDWDLFGSSLYVVNIGIVNARFVWITSVIAIVVGHIAAVYLAHVTALRTFRDNRAALLSQIPMLFLMVAYTMLSLWILAQPVVETG